MGLLRQVTATFPLVLRMTPPGTSNVEKTIMKYISVREAQISHKISDKAKIVHPCQSCKNSFVLLEEKNGWSINGSFFTSSASTCMAAGMKEH